MSDLPIINPLSIPAKYSGFKLSELKPHVRIEQQEFVGNSKGLQVEVLTIEGKLYSVQNDYLVPYYVSPQGEFSRRAEELTLDRARRFFYTAQPEIDVRWENKYIKKAYDDYKACNDPELKAIKAPFLVGEIVNRVERLARVYFQANTEGVEIDLTDEQRKGLEAAQAAFHDLKTLKRLRVSNGKDKVKDETFDEMQRPLLQKIKGALSPIKSEVDGYFQLLLFQEPEIMDYVRLREGNEYSGDGILIDLVREMGKVWGVENTSAERLAREGILMKIGHTMEAIDEMHGLMESLIQNPIAIKALRNAKNTYMDTLLPESVSARELLEAGAEKVLDEYTRLCRARAGTKSEDAPNFEPLRERAALINHVVAKVHSNLRDMGRTSKQADISELRDLLSDGFHLMSEMAQTRMPRNHNAPVDVERRGDTHSVGMFRERVEKWLDAHKGQGAAPTKS